ncbi:unnamed protein product, partial [Cylindrotheca closterium]
MNSKRKLPSTGDSMEPQRKKVCTELAVINLCEEYDVTENEKRIFEKAKANQLVSALIGVAALTAQRKNGNYNYSGDTVIFTLSLCHVAGTDTRPHSLFNDILMGYNFKFPGNCTFGFTLEIPDKRKLDAMITKLLQYQVAVNREKNRVYRTIDGLLQPNTTSKKSTTKALKQSAWERLILISTIYHALQYAIDVHREQSKMKDSNICYFAFRLTIDCKTNIELFRKARHFLLCLGPKKEDCHPKLTAILDNLSFEPQDTAGPKQFSIFLSDSGLGKQLQLEEYNKVLSHFRFFHDIAVNRPGKKKRPLLFTKKNISNNNKHKSMRLTQWLATLSVGLYMSYFEHKSIADSRRLKNSIVHGLFSPKDDLAHHCDSKPAPAAPLEDEVNQKQGAKNESAAAPESPDNKSAAKNDGLEPGLKKKPPLPAPDWRIVTAKEWTLHQDHHGIECYLAITTRTRNLRLELAFAEVYSGSYFCVSEHMRAVKCATMKKDGTEGMMDRSKPLTKFFSEVPQLIDHLDELHFSRPESEVWNAVGNFPVWNA